MESRQPLILLTCDGTATFPWVWSYLEAVYRNHHGSLTWEAISTNQRVE
jgi:hypothetical protein